MGPGLPGSGGTRPQAPSDTPHPHRRDLGEAHSSPPAYKPLGAARCRLHLQVKVGPPVACPGPRPWPPCLLALHGVGQVCAPACASPRRVPCPATPARGKHVRGRVQVPGVRPHGRARQKPQSCLRLRSVLRAGRGPLACFQQEEQQTQSSVASEETCPAPLANPG